MEFKDYYKILSVEPDAEAKDIKAAYRKLARKFHPDVSQEKEAESRFKEVAEAYEVLKDPQKRAEYDELRRYGSGPGGFKPPPGWRSSARPGGGFDPGERDFSDFFRTVFGDAGFADSGFGHTGFSGGNEDRRSFAMKGQDVEMDLPIFLEDTLKEEQKQISYALPHFDERGRRADIQRTLKVKIPAGVSEGERIRLKGQGGPGVGDAANGDLYLRVRLVPHPLFDVEGHNLLITVPVAPWEAALGSKITIPTLESKISLSIPPNSQTGKRLRIKGKGLVTRQGRGDLYAVLKVTMPERHDEQMQKAWQEMSRQAAFDPRAQWGKES